VTLKLKTATFRSLTRARRLGEPTALAHRIFSTGKRLLEDELDGSTRYRLIGIGVSDLEGGLAADPPDLVDPTAARHAAAEHAIDALRARFGQDAIELGLTRRHPRRRCRDTPPAGEG
jgi:DNA polymerase-4